LIVLATEDAREDNPESIRGRLPRPGSSAAASGVQHPGDAGVHFGVIDEDSTVSLIDPFAHGGAEALIIFDQEQRCFLHQARQLNALDAGDLTQSGFLFWSELNFHS
jgi:hypothetical protein